MRHRIEIRRRGEARARGEQTRSRRTVGQPGGGAVDIAREVSCSLRVRRRRRRETVAVVKFAPTDSPRSRNTSYEIATSLGVVAPTTRLFRKAALGVENTPPPAKGDVPGAPVPPADGREWSAALDAARRLSFPVTSREDAGSDEANAADVCEDAEAVAAEAVREDADAAEALARCLEGNQAGLVMRYVRGKPLVPDDLRRAFSRIRSARRITPAPSAASSCSTCSSPTPTGCPARV